MKILENFKMEWPKILKIAAIIFGAVILLVVFVNLVIDPVLSNLSGAAAGQKNSIMPSYAPSSMDASFGASYNNSYGTPELSVRNVYGNEALAVNTNPGNYEVMQYRATVETRSLKNDCALIAGLKSKDYVIFENSNVADRNCNFSFKIKKDKAEEALAVIKSLDPRDLSQNIESIKKAVEDFTSQEEILKNKQASIEETFKSAITAYNEITQLAKNTNNADSLAKVIDSKINILEKLTAQRLQVSSDLEALSRQKAEQLERLEYVNFYVYIYENKIFDKQSLKDSWIASAKQFVMSVDQVLKDLSLGLVMILLSALKYIIYFFFILLAVKFCWKLAKGILKK